MVIYKVHAHGLAVLEAEHHAPVARHAHAPVSRPVALQGVQAEARGIRATGMRRFLQSQQDAPKPGDQMRGEPRAIIPFVERPQPLCRIFMDQL